MPNMMQTGESVLGVGVKTTAGRSVTITQGSTTLTITAVQELREYEVIDASGFLGRVLSVDWIVVVADLAGLALRVGARIVETINSVEQRYDVVPIGKQPCVEPLGTFGTLLTVHSKRVGSG